MKIVFLKWWLFVVLISVVSLFCYYLGIFKEIFIKDTSYLCNLIYLLFFVGTAWCGWNTWKINEIDFKIKNNLEIGWFISELCLTIGMIGTVVGFIMMFSGDYLLKVNVENSQSMMNLIGAVANGMSTALYTTLVGLICSSLLKIQYFNLEYHLNNSDDIAMWADEAKACVLNHFNNLEKTAKNYNELEKKYLEYLKKINDDKDKDNPKT